MAGAVADSPSRPGEPLLLVSAHPLALEQMRQLAGPHGARARCSLPEDAPGEAGQAAVCVVDSSLPAPSRDALLDALLASPCRVIVLADVFDDEDGLRLLRMGVKGLISYGSAPQQLPRAVAAVADGGYWAPRSLISRAVDSRLRASRPRPGAPQGARLSRRENEVLAGVVDSLSNKEIAERLHISERTVKFHVSNLLSKFGVARRSDLMLRSLQPHPPHL